MSLQVEPRSVLLCHLIEATLAASSWRSRLCGSSESNLQAVLAHAKATVPYYRSRLANSIPAFLDFPLVDRATLAKDRQAFQSTAFQASSLRYHTTSGTTGTPLRIARDAGCLYGLLYASYRELAKFIPPFRKGIQVGDIGVVLLDDLHERCPYTYINPEINHALVTRLILGRSPASDEGVIRLLRSATIPLLYARPRCLQRLADLDAGIPRMNSHIRPLAVLSAGDNLYKDMRVFLEEWFRCQVHDCYASQEGGFIAIECAYHNGMHILSNRVKIEMLQNNGQISTKGSGQVVVTNLENWAMPFLRYKTGDTGTVKVFDCPCGYSGPSFIKLMGRDSPYFCFNNQRFNPSLLNKLFEGLPIKQFQVTQVSASSVKVVWIPANDSVEVESVNRAIIRGFTARLKGVEVSVSKADMIGDGNRKVQRYVRQDS